MADFLEERPLGTVATLSHVVRRTGHGGARDAAHQHTILNPQRDVETCCAGNVWNRVRASPASARNPPVGGPQSRTDCGVAGQ